MILTRSPYYLSRTLTQFATRVEWIINTFSKNVAALQQEDTTTINKNRPSDTTEVLFIDASNIIFSNFTYSPITLTELQSNTVFDSRDGEVLSVSVTANEHTSLGGTEALPTVTDIATAGYGYFTDGANFNPNQNILLSHSNYLAHELGYFVVPIQQITESETLTIDGQNIALPATTLAVNKIKYVVVNMSSYVADNIEVIFGNSTINIEKITECKYPVQEVQFLNRFGVVETMHFYKKKVDSISTSNEMHKNAVFSGLTYSTTAHQINQYNKKSNKTFRLSTGIINENYNATIQELLESEKVWLRDGTDVFPVNCTTKNLELKTGLNDKIVEYSLEFEYAFDEISNV